MGKKQWIIWGAAAVAALVVIAAVWSVVADRGGTASEEAEPGEVASAELLYGIDKGQYIIEEGEVESGQTLSTIFARYGIGPVVVDRVARAAEEVFPLRNMRAGHAYTAFLRADSTRALEHFAYEKSLTDFVVISLDGDSVRVTSGSKEVRVERRRCTATISSSLWNCMVDNDLSPALAMDLSDIFAWTIDFFGLQEGDGFTVVYDERYVDSVSVGVGRIWGAIFNHAGKSYYAIPFKQGTKITYWDEQGNSLRKNLLKAPLKFSRISSRFSRSRLHPVLKIRRPHYGVDYAAPSGTPVHAVADGVVVYKGYKGGNGNMVKIKHAGGLMSGYLHLRGYAKGLVSGKRVAQGDLIGYVGSTGISTGPHLDFRLWRNGQPIDPLKVPSEPTEPISAENRADFDMIRQLVLAELNGASADSARVVTQLDSLDVYRAVPVASAGEEK
ncbi:M23 family metallopeptidase [Gallalistipes aquisgranensis]|uniref:M23 family metallopeptidase n=1 Tax=Gallalistipes aquisgranensis TaxID=2779358 RepID=UPI001CF8E94A|nr:peptidoglycan DD-metalloendopeptidase family protein [Gallalistipes aquisgranensis]MBE5033560.1 peptidoglycan DD-metalloendopeptidase family protein [Gallalistipes aquisgranensis]